MSLQISRSSLAISGTLFTLLAVNPTAVNAQDNEPRIDFYGRLHVSADYLNDGSDGGVNVSNNSSRLGLLLDYKVAGNLTLIGQIERGIDVSEGSSTITARNTFLGVKGDWGTLRAGFYDTPVKRIINAVDSSVIKWVKGETFRAMVKCISISAFAVASITRHQLGKT